MNPEDLGFDADRLERVADICHWYVDEGKFPGTSVIVARRGRIAFRDTYGMADIEAGKKIEDDTIFRIFSMTKPITSIALMQLVETGKVLLTNPVSRFIPSFRDVKVYVSGDQDTWEGEPPQREPTIHDILTHMSGLGAGFDRGPIGRIYRANGLAFGVRRDATLAEHCDLLASLPLAFHPGTQWRYGASTDVCGRVVEVVSGMTLDRYFAEHIFEPLRMEDTAFWVPPEKWDRFAQNYQRRDGALEPFPGRYDRPPKMLSGAGGLVGTIDDYHRFATALVRGGELDGARIIGRKTLQYMALNHLPGGADLAQMAAGASETANEGVGFGLGFGVVIEPTSLGSLSSIGEYMWGGAASTAFWVDPVEEITVVFMTQLTPSATYPIRPQLRWTVNQALVD